MRNLIGFKFLFFVFSFFLNAQSERLNKLNVSSKLSSEMINDILRDSSGIYWIATEYQGLHYSDVNYFKSFTTAEGLKTNNILKLGSLGNKLVVGTFDAGAFEVKNQKLIVNSIPYFENQSVYDVAVNGKYFVLSCKGEGVKYLSTENLKLEKTMLAKEPVLRNFLFNGHIINGTSKRGFWVDFKKRIDSANSYFCFAKYGSYLLAGTTQDGFKIYDKHFDEVKYSKDDQISEDKAFITQIEVLGNKIFISGSKFYILELDTVKWHLQSISVQDIRPRCIYKDFNRLLVGTNGTGVNLISLSPFIEQALPYTDKNQKGINGIYSHGENIYIINNKTNLFNNQGGSKRLVYSNLDYELFDVIKSGETVLCATTKGLAVIGNNNDASIHYMLKSKEFEEIELNQIEKIGKTYFISSNGNGLYVCTDNKITNFSSANSLKDNNIYAMQADARGNLWCGYNNSGLSILMPTGQFKHYNSTNGFISNSVECFAEFKGGMLIGTNDTGVLYFDGKQFSPLFKSLSSLGHKIKAICPQGQSIWISTENGLFKILMDEELNAKYVKDYSHFLRENEVEISSGGIKYSLDHGLYFATNKGLFKYDFALDISNLEQPQLVLDGVQLVNKNVDWRNYGQITSDKFGALPIDMNVSHELNSFNFLFHAITLDEVKYSFKLISEHSDEDWSGYSSLSNISYNYLQPGDYILLVRSINSHGFPNKHIIKYNFTIRLPFYKTWWFLLSCLGGIVGSLILYFRWRSKELERTNKELESAVVLRTEELSDSNIRLSHSLSDIRDSINYAKKLQDSILPSRFEIMKLFPQAFLLFKPRDVVSGDFYWTSSIEVNDQKYLFAAVADCTGHGVPGAFMSMMGSDKLNNIVNEKKEIRVEVILNQLNRAVKQAMKQDGEEVQTRDGMDISIVRIKYNDERSVTVHYAGANRPLWILGNGGKIVEVKADKVAIGGYTDNEYQFTRHEFILEKRDRLYMFSDGFPDQFGGDSSKKFMTKKLREVLESNANLPIESLDQYLDRLFINWKGVEDQVDDVLVFGIQL
jgi:serine phosphatase RsbU (regulator of sigma subunit)